MVNGRDSIQAIFIKQTETRHDPKAYTAYRIDVQAAVRQWHIWKRYSDFIKLHEQLSHTFPHNPVPAHLPQKRIFPPTFNSLERIEDRRQGLEDYLRTIQSCRDDRWRKTDIWYHFLALPENEPKATSAEGLTFGSWLDEYDELLTISREIRSLINSRNAHQSQHEVSDAMQCEFKAKKGLATLTARLAILESSLMDDGHVQFLAEGEERRREDKLNRLKVERDVLQQLVSATRQDAHKKKKPAPPPPSSVATAHYGDIGFDTNHQVQRAVTTTTSLDAKPKIGTGRAFGSALLEQQQKKKMLEETEFTKGLDNKELLNYQTQVMKDQDLHIEQFSEILSRQKELGIAINHELENQISILESLDVQVDNTQTKLAFANKKLAKIK